MKINSGEFWDAFDECFSNPSSSEFQQLRNFYRTFWKSFPVLIDFQFKKNVITWVVDSRSMCKEAIHVNKFITFSEQLVQVSQFGCSNKIARNLNNPTQFIDTIFEVRCAHHLISDFQLSSFFWYPELFVNGKTKVPDFKFTLDGVDYYCEAKSMLSNKITQGKSMRLLKQISPKLKNINTETPVRVILFFRGLPKHHNRNLNTQIQASLEEILKFPKFPNEWITLKFKDTCDISIKVELKSTQYNGVKYTETAAYDCDNGNVIIVAYQPKTKKNIRGKIKEALLQLPENMPCIVFLEPLNIAEATSVAKEEVLKANNLAAIFVYNRGNDKMNCFYKNKYKAVFSKMEERIM